MPNYVLKPEVVESCMWEVARQPTHRHFPGYLGLKRTARIDGQSMGLDFDYTGFHDAFLRVRDDDDPYLTPFGPDTDPARHSLWFNRNVAGTYAPSSIRPDQPFSRVVTVEGSGRNATYSLVDEHHKRAYRELLQGQQLPVVPLAGYLYRDFAIKAERGINDGEIVSFETENEPSIETLITIFRDEFGYRENVDSEAEEFDYLYETGEIDHDNPFEKVEE